MKIIVTILVLLGLVGGGGYYYVRYLRAETTSNYRTAKVERGEMLPTIGATGTIEPEEVVDIGCQDNGPIIELKADWGTNVEADQLLAQIDPKVYKAAYDQAAAGLTSAKASLDLAKANVVNADRVLARDEQLMKAAMGALSVAQYDLDKAADGVCRAQVGVAEANIKAAEAALESANTNLGYTRITSPVKGVIIDRRVNVGETVVSALSASSLFLLAKDLTRIQIWASVNEADIGRIQEHQRATFTVDTFPNETFVGEVTQIRLNATMTQNVVTYTVVVTTPNKDLRLKPYMTATVNFEIEQHDNVLKVPNSALRWKPRPVQIAPDIRAETLAAMNRHGDKSKSKQAGDDKPKPAEEDEDQTAPASPGATAGGLATSGGTGAAASPEDWKTRTAQDHAQHEHHAKTADAATLAKNQVTNPVKNDSAAKAEKEARLKKEVLAKKEAQAKKDAESPTKKLATAEHGPPGKPVSVGELAAKKQHYETGYLWTIDGNYVRPIKVKIIATDGTMTEVRAARSKDGQANELREDTDVITGENVAAEGDDSTTNPFMPKLFRGGSKSK